MCSLPEKIDNGNPYVFCDYVGTTGGCIRGAGHNGSHTFTAANSRPPVIPIQLKETQPTMGIDWGYERSRCWSQPTPAPQAAPGRDGKLLLNDYGRNCFDAGVASVKEVCICAAIKVGDLIIRGHRHDDCLRNLNSRPYDYKGLFVFQGFITSRNRFVGREEAMQLQRAAGAKSSYRPDGQLQGTLLFSEDLY